MLNAARITNKPLVAAAVGAFFTLPFLALNLVVVHRVEPLFSLLRPGMHTGPYEYAILGLVLLLLPIGALSAMLPLRRAGSGGALLVVNAVLAALLLTGFVTISFALGVEIYRCDVLGIPNCD